MPTDILIGNRRVGSGHPCFIIAEAGVNHNGDLERARKLVKESAAAGADAVKFQTFSAEKLASPSAEMADYQVENVGARGTQLDMLRSLELPREWHHHLLDEARRLGIIFLSTPFDEESADFLDEMGVDAFKVGSGDLTNLPLLRHVARKRKPLILSTGMSWLAEVEAAIAAVHAEGNSEIILLHCVSSYPAAAADVNLRAMASMAVAFGIPVGYSDHTLGIEVATAAVALGAVVVEKHLTIDKTLPGPDHRASLEPPELRAMIQGIRVVESAMGDGRKRPRPAELNTAQVARKSIVAARDLARGKYLEPDDLVMQRPGTGLSPAMLPHLIGRPLQVDVPAGAMLSWEML
jgi:N,N'-diacetyllegionaminate synthase